MNWKERIYCGDITSSQVGKEVLLMGRVDAIRNHGNILFIHLRDIKGVVQVVFSSEEEIESYKNAESLKEEFVIEVAGTVTRRKEGTENPNLNTGNIEVSASHLTILSGSKTLPFQISEKAMVFGEEIQAGPENVDEDLRLQYRYLDLRRSSIQEKRPGEAVHDRASKIDAKEIEKISKEEVNHVAKLARLTLSDSEAELYQKELNAILTYVETLGELDTENVHPMSHTLSIKNVWREDQANMDKETDPLLSNAPVRKKDYFQVPKILEG